MKRVAHYMDRASGSAIACALLAVLAFALLMLLRAFGTDPASAEGLKSTAPALQGVRPLVDRSVQMLVADMLFVLWGVSAYSAASIVPAIDDVSWQMGRREGGSSLKSCGSMASMWPSGILVEPSMGMCSKLIRHW